MIIKHENYDNWSPNDCCRVGDGDSRGIKIVKEYFYRYWWGKEDEYEDGEEETIGNEKKEWCRRWKRRKSREKGKSVNWQTRMVIIAKGMLIIKKNILKASSSS